MMHSRAARLIVALAAGITLAAAPPEPGESPNRVVIGVRADVSSFNVYTATNVLTQEVSDLLFARLAVEQDDFREGPPSFLPALAGSWEHSEDGRTLTFRLDPGARWSDGSPVTSADVVFSHRAATSAGVGWVGLDVKEMITSVEAPDARTVVYRFSRSYPYALMDAVEGNVIPASHYGKVPFERWAETSFLEAPIASGPFRLGRYERGALIELERNPRYSKKGLPRLESVVFRIIPDETALLNELLTGGIDVMENVPEHAAARVTASSRHRLLSAPDLSYAHICWNTARPLFADVRVRRALTMAIDRKAIIEALVPRTGRPSAGPILSYFWAHDGSLPPLPYDPDYAKRVLREAGWEDRDGDGILDKDGVPFRFELESNQGSSLRNDTAEMVSVQLRKIGVEAVPRILETGAFFAKHEAHDFDAFVSSFRESTKVDLRSVFHTAAAEGGYNHGRYGSRELDDLIDRARWERDPAAARDLWGRAQRIIVRDQPFTFLFERDRLHAVAASLRGVRPSPRSLYAGLEEWHWDREGKPGE